MAKLPSTFRESNKTTARYRKQYSKLPSNIKELTRKACRKFASDPFYPAFRRHTLDKTKRGQHQIGTESISINSSYRALFYVDGRGKNVWYWIGTHEAYNTFTGKK